MNKILIWLAVFLALGIAGLFAYNGYKDNQLAERKLELEEKLALKEAEFRGLDEFDARATRTRQETQQVKRSLKEGFEKQTKKTVTEDLQRLARRVKERVKVQK